MTCASPALQPRLVQARPLLGTLVEIRCTSLFALEAAFQEVARVQTLLSFHEPASGLSRLNAAGHRRPYQVSPELWEVLALAQELAAATGGAFDATVAPRLVSW